MRTARLGLRRIATALAAVGALLLLIAPLLPLAEGAPVGGLRNSLFWHTPIYQWAGFVVAAMAVVASLALWDSESRARIFGPLLLIASGVGTTTLALWLAASDVLERCDWGYGFLTTGSANPCAGLGGRFETAGALGAAMVGGMLLFAAGLILPASTKFTPGQSDERRRRLRSFSYM